MVDKTIVAELQGFFNLKVEDGEKPKDFVKRLVLAAYKMPEEDWETMSNGVQAWVNNALEAIETKQAVSMPSGIEEYFPPKVDSAAEPELETLPAPAKPKRSRGGKKKAKAKKDGAARNRGRQPRFSDSDKIKVLKKPNPFREGSKSHDWYKIYLGGCTVGHATKEGVTRRHILWCVEHEYMALIPAAPAKPVVVKAKKAKKKAGA